jgi:hypothetical protein
MAIIEVSRQNSLNEFREKVNALAVLLGDLSGLSTSEKDSIVEALNSLATVARTGSYTDLINRTIAASEITSGTIANDRLPSSTTSVPGIVQLANALNDTSTSKALTAAQGKVLYDILNPLSSSADTKWTYVSKSSTSTINSFEHAMITSAGTTQTLPASPTLGDKIRISVMNFTNTIINRNGKDIMNLAENLTIDKAYTSIELFFTGDTYGWWIVST